MIGTRFSFVFLDKNQRILSLTFLIMHEMSWYNVALTGNFTWGGQYAVVPSCTADLTALRSDAPRISNLIQLTCWESWSLRDLVQMTPYYEYDVVCPSCPVACFSDGIVCPSNEIVYPSDKIVCHSYKVRMSSCVFLQASYPTSADD